MTYRGLPCKIIGYVKLLRPVNSLMMGLAVVIGELVALDALPSTNVMVLGVATAFFLTASSMVINDYYDVEIDRVNAPSRPLPLSLIHI